MIKNYDLIVFDWDGTIINSIDWIVDCLMHVGVHFEQEVPSEQSCKDIIGLSLSKAMTTLFPSVDEQMTVDMVAVYRQRYMSKAVTESDLFEDAKTVLNALQNQNKTLAVATGKGRSGLDRALDGTKTRHFFQELRCADTMASKPNPQMLFDIMQSTGIAAERTLMIGDSTLDLLMAQKAEVDSIGITTGAHNQNQLMVHQPIACIERLNELLV